MSSIGPTAEQMRALLESTLLDPALFNPASVDNTGYVDLMSEYLDIDGMDFSVGHQTDAVVSQGQFDNMHHNMGTDAAEAVDQSLPDSMNDNVSAATVGATASTDQGQVGNSANPLPPDMWCVVTSIPFSHVYHRAQPEEGYKPSSYMRKQRMVRVPMAKDPSRPMTDTRPSNDFAFMLACCGNKVPCKEWCDKCKNPNAGQWHGCFLPLNQAMVDAIKYACANCMYLGERSRCSKWNKHHAPGE